MQHYITGSGLSVVFTKKKVFSRSLDNTAGCIYNKLIKIYAINDR